MSGGSVFDDDASRKLEAAYLTPDVVAQRRETLRALALQPGERGPRSPEKPATISTVPPARAARAASAPGARL